MIIGICGFKSSGKDTIAELLIQEYGFMKLTFSGALKDIVSIMFGWPRERLDGLTVADREWREEIDDEWAKLLDMPLLSPRYVLQYFGTDLFRDRWHPDIWVKIVEMEIKKNRAKGIPIVIADCRFRNEIELIRANGGLIIHVHRDRGTHLLKPSVEPSLEPSVEPSLEPSVEPSVEPSAIMHRSETEWITCHKDYDVENNGSIEELYDTVNGLIKKK